MSRVESRGSWDDAAETGQKAAMNRDSRASIHLNVQWTPSFSVRVPLHPISPASLFLLLLLLHQVTALSSSTKWNHCSSQNCRHAPSTHFLSWFMVPPASVVLNPDFTPHRSCAAVTGSIDLMEDILRSLHHNRPDRQRGGAVQRSVRGHPCFHQRLRLQRLNIQSKSVKTLLFKPIRSVNSASQTVSRADTLSRLYSSRKWVCGASRRRIALHAFHFGM